MASVMARSEPMRSLSKATSNPHGATAAGGQGAGHLYLAVTGLAVAARLARDARTRETAIMVVIAVATVASLGQLA
jgi:hypothetical protein